MLAAEGRVRPLGPVEPLEPVEPLGPLEPLGPVEPLEPLLPVETSMLSSEGFLGEGGHYVPLAPFIKKQEFFATKVSMEPMCSMEGKEV